MHNTYSSDPPETRPDIISVITGYIPLRKRGRESTGLCPLHADKNPSLAVNEDKQVWYCHACNIGGDVIRFVELVEGVPFKEALNILGIDTQPKPRPVVTTAQRRAAEAAAAWMAEQRRKINVLLGDVLEKIELADLVGNNELAESFIRERSFLTDLYGDLDMSRNAAEMLSMRPMIEAITEGIEL